MVETGKETGRTLTSLNLTALGAVGVGGKTTGGRETGGEGFEGAAGASKNDKLSIRIVVGEGTLGREHFCDLGAAWGMV